VRNLSNFTCNLAVAFTTRSDHGGYIHTRLDLLLDIHIYIYIYICLYVCVCACVRVRFK
jgi:hypothetical protein